MIDEKSEFSNIINKQIDYLNIIKENKSYEETPFLVEKKSKHIEIDKKIFENKISKIKKYIKNSKIQKLVISNIMSYSYKGNIPYLKLFCHGYISLYRNKVLMWCMEVLLIIKIVM